MGGREENDDSIQDGRGVGRLLRLAFSLLSVKEWYWEGVWGLLYRLVVNILSTYNYLTEPAFLGGSCLNWHQERDCIT